MGWFYGVWLAGFLILVGISMAVGSALRRNVWAVLIDTRNKVSLSQFQLFAWTVVGLPLIVAVAIWRMTEDAGSAWEFDIPGELLAVMGITLASTVSSLAIKNVKDSQRPEFVAGRLPELRRPPVADMFAVEEGGGALKNVDVTKLQSFFISAALLASYVWLVIDAFADLDGDVPESLPAFSETMVALLAVSHGGYLVGKIPNRGGSPTVMPDAGQLTIDPATGQPTAISAERAARSTIVTVEELRTM
jgi:hypothetical protein